jgi:hypothetical protein
MSSFTGLVHASNVIRAGFAIVALAASALGGTAAYADPTSSCSASALSAVYVDSTGAAGSVDREYGFKNRSTKSCDLRGYPTVEMLTSSDRLLSTTEVDAPGAWGIAVKPISLAAGAVAYFGLHYAAATGYGNLRCPTSSALELTAPGTTRGTELHGRGGRIRPFGGTTTHLHCGIVHVSAITATRFQ